MFLKGFSVLKTKKNVLFILSKIEKLFNIHLNHQRKNLRTKKCKIIEKLKNIDKNTSTENI